MTGYKLGLDIGGTKTLGVLIDPEARKRITLKESDLLPKVVQ